MLKILAVLSLVVGVLAAKCGSSSCGRAGRKPVRFPMVDKFFTLIVGLSLAVLALTGFFALVFGHPLSGYVLICHTGAGGAFAGSLAVLAVLRAEAESGLGRFLFWTLLVGGLGVVLTAVVMMQPWFGTHGQEVLVDLHRCSSFLAVIGGFGCCGSLMLEKS